MEIKKMFINISLQVFKILSLCTYWKIFFMGRDTICGVARRRHAEQRSFCDRI